MLSNVSSNSRAKRDQEMGGDPKTDVTALRLHLARAKLVRVPFAADVSRKRHSTIFLKRILFANLARGRNICGKVLNPQQSVLIIDEIQKLGFCSMRIQLLIERNKKPRVILTGSSARKLQSGAANLLGGPRLGLPSPSAGIGGAR